MDDLGCSAPTGAADGTVSYTVTQRPAAGSAQLRSGHKHAGGKRVRDPGRFRRASLLAWGDRGWEAATASAMQPSCGWAAAISGSTVPIRGAHPSFASPMETEGETLSRPSPLDTFTVDWHLDARWDDEPTADDSRAASPGGRDLATEMIRTAPGGDRGSTG